MDVKILLLVLAIIVIVCIKISPSPACINNFKYFYNPTPMDQIAIQSSPPMYASTSQQLIPKRIIQTAGSNLLDMNIYHTCNQNKYMNPDYEYIFFDNKSCVSFIQEHFPEYVADFNSIIPGAYKADLFRYLVLYQLGGVYIDCKSAVVEPLSELVSPTDRLILVQDMEKSHIYNGLIASVPRHKVIKAYIDKYIENIRGKRYGENSFDIGGPCMCGEVLNLLRGKSRGTPIELGKHDIGGDTVTVNTVVDFSGKTSVIRRQDGKILFNRAPSNYFLRKLKEMVTLKEYGVRWILRKVYN
jgi:hypothetical protein